MVKEPTMERMAGMGFTAWFAVVSVNRCGGCAAFAIIRKTSVLDAMGVSRAVKMTWFQKEPQNPRVRSFGIR